MRIPGTVAALAQERAFALQQAMSTLPPNVLQNYFEGAARATLIQDQTKTATLIRHTAHSDSIMRYRNAAKSFATHSQSNNGHWTVSDLNGASRPSR